MQDHVQINKYIYTYIYTLLPVSRVFGLAQARPELIWGFDTCTDSVYQALLIEGGVENQGS